MAKAFVSTSDGSEVKLEGTPAEIAAVLKELKLKAEPAPPSSGKPRTRAKSVVGKTTLGGLIDEMIGEGFFKKPKGIGDVKTRLGDLGHPCEVTSLSGPLMHLVRKKQLRRSKDGGKYKYTQ